MKKRGRVCSSAPLWGVNDESVPNAFVVSDRTVEGIIFIYILDQLTDSFRLLVWSRCLPAGPLRPGRPPHLTYWWVGGLLPSGHNAPLELLEAFLGAPVHLVVLVPGPVPGGLVVTLPLDLKDSPIDRGTDFNLGHTLDVGHCSSPVNNVRRRTPSNVYCSILDIKSQYKVWKN